MKCSMKKVYLLIFPILLLGVVSAQAGELRISVAASMTDLFKDISRTYMAQHPDVKIVMNFGPSGGLAKQINQGAPTDFYVSANPKWMDYLIEQKKVDAVTRKTFAHNILVFVGIEKSGVDGLEDLAALQRIGLGSPKSVPAGQYAKEALEKKELWRGLLSGGKLVMAKDVRQALIYADRGETDGSFVYKTDAMLARNAKVLFKVPQELYNKVTYPLAITTKGRSNKDAVMFYQYVTSTAVHRKLMKYGFSLPQ